MRQHGWTGLLAGVLAAWSAGSAAHASTVTAVISSHGVESSFTMVFDPSRNSYIYRSLENRTERFSDWEKRERIREFASLNAKITYFHYEWSNYDCAYQDSFFFGPECVANTLTINPSLNLYERTTNFYWERYRFDVKDSIALDFYDANGARLAFVPGPATIPLPMTGALLGGAVAALAAVRRWRAVTPAVTGR